MTIASGDPVVKQGTQKTLEANGAIAANDTMILANDSSYVRNAIGHDDAPDGKFVLSFTIGVAGTANTLIDVYVRRLNMDGTNNAQAPTTSFKQEWVGSFKYNNAVTGIQYAEFDAKNLPADGDYYINNNTGQSIAAGWTLKVTPKTIGFKA